MLQESLDWMIVPLLAGAAVSSAVSVVALYRFRARLDRVEHDLHHLKQQRDQHDAMLNSLAATSTAAGIEGAPTE